MLTIGDARRIPWLREHRGSTSREAVTEAVGRFQPRVTGGVLVRPRRRGVRQDPPLPVVVEVNQGALPDLELARAIQHDIRMTLLVSAEVKLVPPRSLPRSEYKSKLVDFSEAEGGDS